MTCSAIDLMHELAASKEECRLLRAELDLMNQAYAEALAKLKETALKLEALENVLSG